MKKFVFPILVFVFVSIASASDTFACSCAPAGDAALKTQVTEAYKKSSNVFSGEVIEITKGSAAFTAKVKFKIDKSWKKKIFGELTVITATDSALCGYFFEVGKKYVVYTYGENSNSRTDICTRTALLKSSKDVAILNKIKKPKN